MLLEVTTPKPSHLELQRRESMHLMCRQVKSAIGRKKPVHEAWIILPTLNLLLKSMEVAALQIKIQQATGHQVIQTWGLNWGPQRWFGDVHLDSTSC